MGSYLGAIFGAFSINTLGIGTELYEEFVVIGMAGLFASIVRSPITGIVLVYELTGNMNNILPLATVSLISYAVANLIGVNPFYDLLLDRSISSSRDSHPFERKNEKILKEYVIPVGIPLNQQAIMAVDWGKHCLVVSIEREGVSITPKGDTVLKEGDALVILVSQRRFSRDNARLEQMIRG